MKRVRVKRTREYYPHHTLLGAADTNLDLAEKQEPGRLYFEMAAILFSGLAIEALANSFGERYVVNWKDYESSSPIAKLQIVSNTMGASYDEQKLPWCHARRLIKFRNRLAHAKPEMIKIEKEMSEEEWTAARQELPNSKIEDEITLKNAKKPLVPHILSAIYSVIASPKTTSTVFGPMVGAVMPQ